MKLARLFVIVAAIAINAEAAKRDLIVAPEPFTADATVGLTELGEPVKVESGSINGVRYRIYYSDGSGSFSGTPGSVLDAMEPTGTNWDVRCKKDAVTDKKICSMHIKDLWIYTGPTGASIVSIGNGHYPGSSITVRVDGGSPITAPAGRDGVFSSAASVRIISQLRNAKSLTTRYMKWPYREWVDETWEPYGFNEAMQYINWAVKRAK